MSPWFWEPKPKQDEEIVQQPALPPEFHRCPNQACRSIYCIDVSALKVRWAGGPHDGKVQGAVVCCGVCGTIYLSTEHDGVITRNPAFASGEVAHTTRQPPPSGKQAESTLQKIMGDLRWRTPKV